MFCATSDAVIDEFILNWLTSNKQNAWMVVPILAFLEACPGIGLLVSGVILLTISTVLYTEQLATLSQIMTLAFMGALLSDHIGFYLGRWLGPRFHHHPFAIKRAKQLQKSEAFILKYGAAAIILGRLMTAVRSLVPMLVGISGTSRVTFSVIDVAACVIWSLGLGGLVIGLDNLLPG